MTVIEQSGRKITVMTSRPSELPSELLSLKVNPGQPQLTPVVNATKGPTYSDAFAQFLMGKSSVPTEPAAPKALTPVQQPARAVQVSTHQTSSPFIPAGLIPPKTLVKVEARHQPSANKLQVANVKPLSVDETRKQQEEWTIKILQQTQQSKPAEKVKTERIQPYIAGQSELFSIKPIVTSGQPVLYGINSNDTAKSSQQKKQQSC